MGELLIKLLGFAILLSLIFVKFQKSLNAIFPSEEELNKELSKYSKDK